MNNSINFVVIKNSIELRLVKQIRFIESQWLSGDLPYTVQGFCFAVAQVVNDDDLLIRIQEFHAGMASDITGTSGYQYRHHEFGPFMFSFGNEEIPQKQSRFSSSSVYR
jgi:hypothetical protein